jgi:hypothetical protein
MTELLALSVSVAVLGGIWAFIALGPLGGFALVWVGFIAAGCFFAAGGDIKALSKTIVGMIYGAIVAWIALLIIAKVPVPALPHRNLLHLGRRARLPYGAIGWCAESTPGGYFGSKQHLTR